MPPAQWEPSQEMDGETGWRNKAVCGEIDQDSGFQRSLREKIKTSYRIFLLGRVWLPSSGGNKETSVGRGCRPGHVVIPDCPDASNKWPLWGLITAGHAPSLFFFWGGDRVVLPALGRCWERQTRPYTKASPPVMCQQHPASAEMSSMKKGLKGGQGVDGRATAPLRAQGTASPRPPESSFQLLLLHQP